MNADASESWTRRVELIGRPRSVQEGAHDPFQQSVESTLPVSAPLCGLREGLSRARPACRRLPPD